MIYKTTGLTRKAYEQMLNETLGEKILNFEIAKEVFSKVKVQERYLLDAVEKKTLGRFIRKFQCMLFEEGFKLWKKSLQDANKNIKRNECDISGESIAV